MNRLYIFCVFLLAILIAIIVGMDKAYPHETGKYISIESDGKGYYAYLPAVFIHHNLSTLPENKAFTNQVDGRNFIKYPPGTALLQAPFFTVALVYCSMAGNIIHGKELPFQISIQMAAIFYLLLGLWFTRKVLENFGFKSQNIYITVLTVFFGTNLLFYALFSASMSHVYSFAAVAGLMFFIQKYFLLKELKWLLMAVFSMSIVVLIRPFNLIILLVVPLFTKDFNDLKHQVNYLIHKPKWLLLACLIGAFMLSFQPLVWYLQTEKWLLWSYKDEGFYFLKPEIINILFSFKRGLFIYTPVLLLALPGFFFLKKQNRWKYYWLFSFLILLIYLVSCWWNWYYGDGFGHRAFIDYFVLFAIVIAFAIDKIKNGFWRVVIAIFIFSSVALNLIQTYQFRAGILHPHSMNAEKYNYVFLKTSSAFIHSLGGNSDIKPYSKSTPVLYLHSKIDFEIEQENWEVNRSALSSSSRKIKNQVAKFSGDEFGLKFTIPFNNEIAACNKLLAHVQLTRLDSMPQSSAGALLVIEKQNTAGENLYYYTFPINDIPSQKAGQIDSFQYSFDMPRLNNKDEYLSIYLWNQKKGTFEIDEISISIYLFH